jgi:predicted dehydrogenase
MTGSSTARGPVRLGIVGCGAIVREAHLPVIVGDPRIEVAMLCDRNRKNALVMQREFGLECRVTETLSDLAGQVDAAIVAVPPRLHAPLTVQLLEMGIDVLCEKPLAISAADGARMAETARARDRVLAVALMTRFYPHNARLRELVADGELGDLEEIVAEDGAPLDWAMTTDSYFDRKATAGGVLFDSGVHLLDRVLWLFGDLHDIEYEDDAFGGVETNALLRGVLQGDGGQRVPARMEFSWSHRLPRRIQVIGTKGTLEARIQDPRTLTLHRKTRRGTLAMQIPCADNWSPSSAYRAQISDFIEAVRERRAPFVTAESALRALAVVETAYARKKPMAQPWLERARGCA